MVTSLIEKHTLAPIAHAIPIALLFVAMFVPMALAMPDHWVGLSQLRLEAVALVDHSYEFSIQNA